MTIYDVPSYMMVENDLKRYAIGDRTPGLKRGSDGSLELYLQHGSPEGGKQVNWLPAPSGPFYVLIRMYAPKRALVSGDYKLPRIKRAQ